MVDRPKISFVVAVRNPHYGNKNGMNNAYRMRLFVENLIFLCNKHKLRSELVVVEWNPERSGDFFRKVIQKKQLNLLKKLLTITWIEVPSEIHKKIPNSKKIPIFEFFAKNVGIRRAHGTYIISTNPDLLHSDSLIRYLTYTTLLPNCFYRIDRSDVQGYIPYKLSVEEKLKYCSNHIIKKHALYGSFKPVKSGILYFWSRHTQEQKLLKEYWSGEGLVAYPDGLHRNASGDFFLMARNDWFKLRGYAEINTHAHIDSIMCWQAITAGLEQVILPDRYKLYHIDHDRKIRLSFPQTNWAQWYKKFKQCQTHKKLLLTNDSDWGLRKISLKTWRVADYCL